MHRLALFVLLLIVPLNAAAFLTLKKRRYVWRFGDYVIKAKPSTQGAIIEAEPNFFWKGSFSYKRYLKQTSHCEIEFPGSDIPAARAVFKDHPNGKKCTFSVGGLKSDTEYVIQAKLISKINSGYIYRKYGVFGWWYYGLKTLKKGITQPKAKKVHLGRRRFGDYLIKAKPSTQGAIIEVKPNFIWKRSFSYKRYLKQTSHCEIKFPGSDIPAARAVFKDHPNGKRCTFSVGGLKPDTEYVIQAKLISKSKSRYMDGKYGIFGWWYYGLETLKNGTMKPKLTPTTKTNIQAERTSGTMELKRTPSTTPAKKTTTQPESTSGTTELKHTPSTTPTKMTTIQPEVPFVDLEGPKVYSRWHFGDFLIKAKPSTRGAIIEVKPNYRRKSSVYNRYLKKTHFCQIQFAGSRTIPVQTAVFKDYPEGKRCTFSIGGLTPDTSYVIQAKLISEHRSFTLRRLFGKFGLRYEGLKTLKGRIMESTTASRPTVKTRVTGNPLGYKMVYDSRKGYLLVKFILTPGSRINRCEVRRTDKFVDKMYQLKEVQNGRCEFRLNVLLPEDYKRLKFKPPWLLVTYTLTTPDLQTTEREEFLDYYEWLSIKSRSTPQYEIVYKPSSSPTKIVVYPLRAQNRAVKKCRIELKQPPCEPKTFEADYNTESKGCKYSLNLPNHVNYNVRVQTSTGYGIWSGHSNTYSVLKIKRGILINFGGSRKRIVCR